MQDIRSRIMAAYEHLVSVIRPNEFNEETDAAVLKLAQLALECEELLWDVVAEEHGYPALIRPRPGFEELARLQKAQITAMFERRDALQEIIDSPEDYEPVVVSMAAIRAGFILHRMRANVHNNKTYGDFIKKMRLLVMDIPEQTEST